MELRPYQTDAISQIREAFSQKKRRVVLCLPTGGGKTVIFSEMVRRAMERDLFAKVLILTDRMELLTQAGGTLQRLGIKFDTIEAGKKVNMSARCHVGMVETYVRRGSKNPDLFGVYDLVIIDEAHKGNFKKVLNLLPEKCFVIGATATPISTSRKDPLKNYFQDIVCPVSIPDLVGKGYLVPARTFSAKLDRSALKTKMGEYTDESLMEMFDKRVVYQGVIEKWKEFGENRKTICFNVNVLHSIKMAEEFNNAGIPSKHLDGTTPKELREKILREFKLGEFKILCNVGIVTTGYDEPSVSCIIVNRATQSIPLWLQMCGRGSRLYPGKENFHVIDMGENYRFLGLWGAERDWIDLFNNPKKPGEGIAPTKECPCCEAIIPASVRICPYCDAEFEPSVKDSEEAFADFEEIIESSDPVVKPPRYMWHNLDVSEMAQIVKAEIYKSGWAVRVIKDRNKTTDEIRKELTDFAKHMGYKLGWVNYQLQA